MTDISRDRASTLAAMATRLASTSPSQPTGEPGASEANADLSQDNLILEFNIIIWVLVGVAGFFLFLRAYCKITRQRGLWWDDHVMGLAWVSIVLGSPMSSLHRHAPTANEGCVCGEADH